MAELLHPEFEQQRDLIYLNHAAVAPWPRRTAHAVQAFAQENVEHGPYYYAKWLEKLGLLREQGRQLLNARSTDEIALVKNTSEALSFVAYGINWSNGDNIVSSNEEFPSNRIPWQSLAEAGVEFREADLLSAPSPEETLFQLVDRKTRMLTISSVQFASGIRVNLQLIGEFCKERNILFCIDAIQSLGALEFDVEACQADFVMADGHKWMLGPEGLGIFYINQNSGEHLKPSQYGWHMIDNSNNYENEPWQIAKSARRFECGSSNMVGAYALSASLSLLLETGIQTVESHILDRSTYLIDLIDKKSELELLSPKDKKLRSGIVLFRHRQQENDKLFARLRSNRVSCAKRGRGIRFSPHFYNTFNQLEIAINLCCAP